MVVDCEERMLIAQRWLQVLSDPRARLLSHTDAAALVICSDNRRTDPERCSSMRRTRSPYCARATTGHAAALPSPAMKSRCRIGHASRPLWWKHIRAEDAWERATSPMGCGLKRRPCTGSRVQSGTGSGQLDPPALPQDHFREPPTRQKQKARQRPSLPQQQGPGPKLFHPYRNTAAL